VGWSPLKIDHFSSKAQVAQDNEIIFLFFSLRSLLCKTLRSFARKHCKEGASVVTQFLTHHFDKIFRKSKK
jgi:hypothetical protein